MKGKYMIYLGLIFMIWSCGNDDGEGEEMAGTDAVEEFLLANPVLPTPIELVASSDVEVTETVSVSSVSDDPVVVLKEDGRSSMTLSITSSDQPITHLALKPGNSTQLQLVSVSDFLNTTGDTLVLPITRPAAFCAEFSGSCQKIDTEVSVGFRGNDGTLVMSTPIMISLAAICGECTEVSCSTLLSDLCWVEEDDPNRSSYTFQGVEYSGGLCDVSVATASATGFFTVRRGQSALDPGVSITTTPASGRFQLPFPNYLQNPIEPPVLTVQLTEGGIYYGVSGTLDFSPNEVRFDVMVELASTLFNTTGVHERLPLKGRIVCP